jgi:hypothetical protein
LSRLCWDPSICVLVGSVGREARLLMRLIDTQVDVSLVALRHGGWGLLWGLWRTLVHVQHSEWCRCGHSFVVDSHLDAGCSMQQPACRWRWACSAGLLALRQRVPFGGGWGPGGCEELMWCCQCHCLWAHSCCYPVCVLWKVGAVACAKVVVLSLVFCRLPCQVKSTVTYSWWCLAHPLVMQGCFAAGGSITS